MTAMHYADLFMQKYAAALAAAAAIELELPSPPSMKTPAVPDRSQEAAGTGRSLVSAVIEMRDGANERVLGTLAGMQPLSVYGIKGNKIVAVVEGDTFQAARDLLDRVAGIAEVIAVRPVSVRRA